MIKQKKKKEEEKKEEEKKEETKKEETKQKKEEEKKEEEEKEEEKKETKLSKESTPKEVMNYFKSLFSKKTSSFLEAIDTLESKDIDGSILFSEQTKNDLIKKLAGTPPLQYGIPLAPAEGIAAEIFRQKESDSHLQEKYLDAIRTLRRGKKEKTDGLLCSSRARCAIMVKRAALTARTQDPKNSAPFLIGGVPLNTRIEAMKVLEVYLKKKLGTHRGTNPLLCNHGSPGSGKSMQLAFNMDYFVEAKKKERGIAIEVSFNDDSHFLDLPIDQFSGRQEDTFESNPQLFERCMTKAILLRVAEYVYGSNYSRDNNTHSDAILFQQLRTSKLPRVNIKTALQIARIALNLPPLAPVLLVVDEIGKTNNGSYYLSKLCSMLDAEGEEIQKTERAQTVWLSVSSIGCLEIIKMSTGSNRGICLQPLPPIFPVTFDGGIEHLSLFSGSSRKTLPYTPNYLAFYRDVSNLLMTSGGNPRRIEVLLKEFEQLEFSKILLPIKLTKLTKETIDYVKSQMDKAVSVPKSFNHNVLCKRQDEKNADFFLKQFLCDLAHPFVFPNHQHNQSCSLLAVEEGSCVFVPVRDSYWLSMILFPALEGCVEPLKEMADAVISYATSTDKNGKKFELCFAHAVAGHLSGVPEGRTITLASMLRAKGNSELFKVPLKPLSKNTVDTKLTYFPSFIKNSNVQFNSEFTNTLAPGVFLPSENFNLECDFFVVLATDCHPKIKWIIVLFQAKDWFQETISGTHILDEWRWGHQFVSCEKVNATKRREWELDNSKAFNFFTKPEIAFVHILASANRINCEDGKFAPHVKFQNLSTHPDCYEQKLLDNEAITDLEHMQDWFPTVAYNTKAIHKLQSIWMPPKEKE